MWRCTAMPDDRTHVITALLEAWRDGNKAAQEDLFPLVYGELKRLARRHLLKERPGEAFRATFEPKVRVIVKAAVKPAGGEEIKRAGPKSRPASGRSRPALGS